MKKSLYVILSLSFVSNFNAMDIQKSLNDIYAIKVPGQNGLGCDSYERNFIINTKSLSQK